jgi:hypothetical protein
MIDNKTLEFYQKNKDCTWPVEPLPSGTILEQASWILNKSNFGWIELDLDVDLAGWQLEAMMSAPWLVPHREDDNIGWTSACIHGIDVESTGPWTSYGYTDETTVPYRWTELSHRSPIIKRFWQEQFPSDSYRRIRFMALDNNSAITPHSDMPGRLPGEDNFDALAFGIPINIAVIHPENCHMVLEGYGTVPFQEGKAFIVNIRNYHTVVNFSDKKRIHVIGHSYGYGNKLNEFAELVVRSYKKMYSVS